MRKDSNIGTLNKRTMNRKRWKLAFNYGQKKGRGIVSHGCIDGRHPDGCYERKLY